MNSLLKSTVTVLLILLLVHASSLYGANQTATLSPVLSEDSLPFTIRIEEAPFTLPTGIQGYASGIYDGKWVLLCGRTNGLHGFGGVGNNFPPALQNKTVFVIDYSTGQSWSRSLESAASGLSQDEIDSLSVTVPQFFQKGKTLYVVGGYGIDTSTGTMGTKSILTAIDLKRLIKWVVKGASSVKNSIKQVSHPLLRVTGGALFQASDHDPFLLMLGQNFIGLYTDGSNGIYTRQMRSFWLTDDGKNLHILPNDKKTTIADYRRRDLNIVPIMRKNKPAYTAYSGVFTLTTGVWTVPITIFPDGSSFQEDPNSPESFKQAMNNYNCPVFGLYSTSTQEMYSVFPGGISFGFFSAGTFTTDPGIPFINQVTTVKIDHQGRYTQHLMDNQYPTILSTGSNPGNTLLFGAEAQFFPADGIATFYNGVIQLDALPSRSTVVGFIAGGIMSTLPNTNATTDSTASPYVFQVKVIPK